MGRVVPDVARDFDRFDIPVKENFWLVSGTSTKTAVAVM